MNFKPVKLKVIGTILAVSVLSFPLHDIFFPCKPIITDIPGLIADPVCAFSPPYFLGTFWGVAITLVLLIYTLWSLFAKK